jgi:hypothetical protein
MPSLERMHMVHLFFFCFRHYNFIVWKFWPSQLLPSI